MIRLFVVLLLAFNLALPRPVIAEAPRLTEQLPPSGDRGASTFSGGPRGSYGQERPVTIVGYEGDAMEPFISRDDRLLLFNSLNDSKDTSLYFANRVDDTLFRFGGRVGGVNGEAPHLDAVASADKQGKFYWVSNREYPQRYENLMRGVLHGGTVKDIERVPGDIYVREPGWIIMDAEISPDGQTLFYANAHFSGGPIPESSKIAMALSVSGTFVRDPQSERLLAQVNTGTLEYAPSSTSDGLSLFFTRLVEGRTSILLARRTSTTEPFGSPEALVGDGDTPEAPSVSRDQRLVYFHRRFEGRYRIFVLTRIPR